MKCWPMHLIENSELTDDAHVTKIKKKETVECNLTGMILIDH